MQGPGPILKLPMPARPTSKRKKLTQVQAGKKSSIPEGFLLFFHAPNRVILFPGKANHGLPA